MATKKKNKKPLNKTLSELIQEEKENKNKIEKVIKKHAGHRQKR